MLDRAMDRRTFVQDAEELRALLGEPMPRAVAKERTVLHPLDVQWIGASRFVLVATADADGRCDVSPKGDPAGCVKVLGPTTLAIPERPGNRRADSLLNVLSNPGVGLLFLIPGRNDTLRVNGRARIVREAPYLETMEVAGHQPKLALEVEVEQIFYHCAKAFMRAKLWEPSAWTPDAAPSRPRIAQEVEARDQTLEELETYYGPAYAKKLYG